MAGSSKRLEAFPLWRSETALSANMSQSSPFMSPEETPPQSAHCDKLPIIDDSYVSGECYDKMIPFNQRPALTPFITKREVSRCFLDKSGYMAPEKEKQYLHQYQAAQQDWQFNQLLYEDETSERIPLQQMQQFGINGKSSSSPPCPGSPGTFVMPLSLKNEISQDHTSVSIGSSSSAKANHSWKVLPNTPLQMFYDLQACEGMKRSRRTESPVLPLWIAPEDNWPGNSQISDWVEKSPSVVKAKEKVTSVMTSINEFRKKDSALLPMTVKEPSVTAFKYRKSVAVVVSAVASFFILLFLEILV